MARRSISYSEAVETLRGIGWTWTRIAAHYGVSEREARRWADEGAPERLPAHPLAVHYRAALVVNDLQFPYYDRAVWEVTCQVAADNEVEVVVWNGDIFDFPQLSSFKHDPHKVATAREDVLAFHREVREPLLTSTHYGVEEWWLDGNHEDRYTRYCEHNASALGDADPIRFMGLGKMARYLPYGERLGHRLTPQLMVTHGWLCGRTATRAMVEQTGMSLLHGHTHRVSSWFMTTANGVVGGWECGHMSDPSRVPGFHKAGDPNWQQVVGTVVRQSRTGHSFHVEVGQVFGCHSERAIVNGREYELDRPRQSRHTRPPVMGTEGVPSWIGAAA
jgi:hypothetical protein